MHVRPTSRCRERMNLHLHMADLRISEWSPWKERYGSQDIVFLVFKQEVG